MVFRKYSTWLYFCLLCACPSIVPEGLEGLNSYSISRFCPAILGLCMRIWIFQLQNLWPLWMTPNTQLRFFRKRIVWFVEEMFVLIFTTYKILQRFNESWRENLYLQTHVHITGWKYYEIKIIFYILLHVIY